MRIALWTDPFWPSIGGVERLAVQLARSLTERGHEVLVITNQQKSVDADELDLGGVRIERLPMVEALDRRDAGEILDLQIALGKLIEEFRPQVFHLFCAMLAGFYDARIVRKIRCPILYSEQTGSFRLESMHPLQRRVAESADWYVPCSHSAARIFGELFPETEERTTVVYNAIELGEDKPYSPPPSPEPVLLLMGRHQLEQKGFDLAVAAMPEILRKFPTAKLRIAGDGQHRGQLERMVSEMELSSNVEFVGWIHPDRVGEAIGQCTMMIVPSRFEPFGLVAAETGAAQRPCIVTDVGGVAEIIEDGRTGLIIPPENPAAIARAVCELLSRPEDLPAMGMAARQRVKRMFDINRMVDEFDALYRMLPQRFPEKRI